ncbi:MAG: YkgJ family cysteine cluster protein [Candidatus Aenigmatarchaeota archaeon]
MEENDEPIYTCIPGCGYCCVEGFSLKRKEAEKLLEGLNKEYEEIFFDEGTGEENYLKSDGDGNCILLDDEQRCQGYSIARPKICEPYDCRGKKMIENLIEEGWPINIDLKELYEVGEYESKDSWLSFAEDVIKKVHTVAFGPEETEKFIDASKNRHGGKDLALELL